MVQGVLSHEMIHMFDYCRNKLEFDNLDHLACTEIRAANLCHCSFLSSWIQGHASFFNIAETHQVKRYTKQVHVKLNIYCMLRIKTKIRKYCLRQSKYFEKGSFLTF